MNDLELERQVSILVYASADDLRDMLAHRTRDDLPALKAALIQLEDQGRKEKARRVRRRINQFRK